MLYQSLKSIRYRILLIFQNKKTTDLFEGQNMGGDKRHVIPPMSKHGGDTSPPSPPGFTPLALTEAWCGIIGVQRVKVSTNISTNFYL